jgi:hypothetical protein
MNSDLPSLLGAIFGKKDLGSVSLEELYDVISEFPSFNAAHFFLSKKLRQQDHAAYEKESMRTALYFNNAFWLQSILEEGNHTGPAESPVSRNEEESEKPVFVESINETFVEETETPVIDFTHPPVIAETSPEIESHPQEPYQLQPQSEEYDKGPITSFDELISKYKIEDIVDESPAEMPVDPEHPASEAVFTEMKDEPAGLLQVHVYEETKQESSGMVQFEEITERNSTSDSGQFETREEILNEYGIFEEVVVKISDHEPETFDRPNESSSPEETLSVENPPSGILQRENESIVENQHREEASDKSDAGDYEAFDRPIDQVELNGYPNEIYVAPVSESEANAADADNTGDPEFPYYGQKNEPDNRVPDSAGLFQQQQKPTFAFDTKKAESIVFAPYHMIDYFASQGIKLVLEDNPADSFGKQLKSFTDWLKVMKKLPAKPESGKTDEQEAARIRHFAAHSIEERDILTESMAEVLAKQGMYENAIALYQKLSLIYPPKSAYFASRIEQIKASLP